MASACGEALRIGASVVAARLWLVKQHRGHAVKDRVDRRRARAMVLHWDQRPAAGRNIMIVITRNGRTTVLTGWRAWLLGAVAFVASVVVFALVAFVVLGVAVTVGAVMLIVVPIALGLAILASFFRSPSPR